MKKYSWELHTEVIDQYSLSPEIEAFQLTDDIIAEQAEMGAHARWLAGNPQYPEATATGRYKSSTVVLPGLRFLRLPFWLFVGWLMLNFFLNADKLAGLLQ